jgi:two-component system response regulator DevR
MPERNKGRLEPDRPSSKGLPRMERADSVPSKIRVAVIDDHPLVREGLVELASIWDEVEVVGTGASAEDAIAIAATTLPDVFLLDYKLEDGPSTGLCRSLTSRFPDVKVLVLTIYDDPNVAVEMLRAGALGYVLKDSRAEEIREAIQRVMRGESPLDGRVVKGVIAAAKASRNPADGDSSYPALDGREQRLLAMVAAGLSNREIADRLYVSEKTVKNMLTKLYKKLGVPGRNQAAALGVRLGLHRLAE